MKNIYFRQADKHLDFFGGAIVVDLIRFLLLVNLVGAQLCAAEWQRYVGTAKSSWVDKSSPHPIAYFTEYPMLRDESGDFCYLCSPEERLAEAKKYKCRTELTLVGTLSGFPIYDLYYRFNPEDGADTKAILVKVAPDQYREIYRRHPTQNDARVVPSRFVRVGNDQFLEAQYFVGGKAGSMFEYFWFDTTGATLVDFRPVITAAQLALPAERIVDWYSDDDKAMPGSHYLWRYPRPLTTFVGLINSKNNQERGGTILVAFKFDHGRVVPTKTTYDPLGRQPE